MKTGLVSIAIPVYNVEKYLEECLNSIINQTYKKLEIILVNDGSTDSSLDICKRYLHDERITIIDKKNEGLSVARQAAIDKASGDYLCMIDSDDFIETDFIEKLYEVILKDNSDIALCASIFFSESSRKVYGFSETIPKYKIITKNDIENSYSKIIGQYYMSDSWAKMYKLVFIRKSKIRFTLNKTFNGTDLLFNHLLILSNPKISITNNILYNHRIHSESRVHRKEKKMFQGFQLIMDAIISESNKLNFSDLIYNQYSYIYIQFLKVSAEDIIDSSINFNNILLNLKEFFKANKDFIDSNNKLKINTKVFNRINDKIFALIITTNNSLLMYFYIKLRSVIVRLAWTSE